jgi:hypothetical protein
MSTLLITLIRQQKLDLMNIENYKISYSDFHQFNAGNMNAVAILYQSGYLTIVNYKEDRKQFLLDYPNVEVKSCFAKSLLEEYFAAGQQKRNDFTTQFMDYVYDGEVEKMMLRLKEFLKAIPNTIIEDREKYFQTAVHLIFRMFGFDCRSEVALADGRVDTMLETADQVYLFEFKYEKSAEEALSQIDTKEYLLPWESSGKTRYRIGVNFSGAERNITEWKWVKM